MGHTKIKVLMEDWIFVGWLVVFKEALSSDVWTRVC